MPDDIEAQLEARNKIGAENKDSFINDYPSSSLLADNTSISSETFQTGGSENISIRHDDSNPVITKVGSIFASSEISIDELIFPLKTTNPYSSSQSSFLKSSHSNISSSERSIIGVAHIQGSTNQDAVVEVDPTQVGILKSNFQQSSFVETDSFQVGIINNGTSERDSSKISSYQNNSTQIQAVQIGSTQINSRKVSFSTIESFPQFFSIHNSTPQIINELNNSATQIWSNLLQTPTQLNLNFQITNLPSGQLAETTITNYSPNGTPTAGTITIDDDANGIGWYIDTTPFDNNEFSTKLTDTAYQASTNSPAYGKYDLLTTILHEMGHLYGFINGYQGFEFLKSQDLQEQHFTPDGSHLDNSFHPYDLMNTSLKPGIRKLPSSLNQQILQSITQPNLRNPEKQLQASLTSSPLLAIANSDFSIDNPLDPNYGWNHRGDANILNGQAMLSEDSPTLSNFQQTFIIPEGVKTLRIKISDIKLGGKSPKTNLNNGDSRGIIIPPDAFEIALLEADTFVNLVKPITNLNHSDSLYNIQANGTLYSSDRVRLSSPSSPSPSSSSSSPSPQTITIDISHLNPGTKATLYFDLLGFGALDSQIIIDEITPSITITSG